MRICLSLLFFLFLIPHSQSQTIYTVAGNGTQGFSGDGITATQTNLFYPTTVACDDSGNFYVCDDWNQRIRKVEKATGKIVTVAGTGVAGYTSDGVSATSSELNYPVGIAIVDSLGKLYIADTYNQRIRLVNLFTGEISTVAGLGSAGYSGDGGLAVNAELHTPTGIAADLHGNLFIADEYNNCIRKVVDSTGVITTVVGTDTSGYNGDNRTAVSAWLNQPTAVTLDRNGNIYIADQGNSRVRKVTVATGMISTIAGKDTAGFAGDGDSATRAKLWGPNGLVLDPAGNVYISDGYNNRIRFLNSVTGIISTVAGDDTAGYSGDNRSAAAARLYKPVGVALDPLGNLFIADTYNNRVREVVYSVEGVQEYHSGNPLRIYPNPAVSACYIETGSVGLEVLQLFDTYGRCLQSFQVTGGKASLDLSGLPAGLYNVVITGLSAHTGQRLVKIK
jgi:sugar lactone lactonase YvrE